MPAEQSLKGRVALVTGASRGIGRAIAQRLAAHGAALVVTASPRSKDGLRDTCARIEKAGGRAAWLAVDLADAAARDALVARAAERFGPIDILVNNAAGIGAYAPPSRIDRAARVAMFDLDLQAPIDLIQQALPTMRERGWGRILNLSSEMARQPPIPYPGPAKQIHALALYGCAKAALERYTLALAAELHGSGVCVNAVMPYKIAHTEGAAQVAQAMSATHPDWVEPVEMLAEASYHLIAGDSTGWIAVSREVLQRAQSKLHALDGVTVIGDALTRDRDIARA
ncbi:SDR family NAD(P)-dependent oxidoreductase [Fontimonas sp. SYSU GA230001]|uniref:SDR family NAD(P)-dependent oxidoreductase n=1 Tax=Fontimonas sp. SYSU GA230001 TaxID=3142450 RepID=UPI0032B479C8